MVGLAGRWREEPRRALRPAHAVVVFVNNVILIAVVCDGDAGREGDGQHGVRGTPVGEVGWHREELHAESRPALDRGADLETEEVREWRAEVDVRAAVWGRERGRVEGLDALQLKQVVVAVQNLTSLLHHSFMLWRPSVQQWAEGVAHLEAPLVIHQAIVALHLAPPAAHTHRHLLGTLTHQPGTAPEVEWETRPRAPVRLLVTQLARQATKRVDHVAQSDGMALIDHQLDQVAVAQQQAGSLAIRVADGGQHRLAVVDVAVPNVLVEAHREGKRDTEWRRVVPPDAHGLVHGGDGCV
mmetsp:Transcript_18658/g.53461  ORF Transcript_18658/g.53461 Transcript_18658/m.53461 type:complete len:298 (+) Transcript_18658:948-1841(+)